MFLGTMLGTQSFLTLVAAAFLSFGRHGAEPNPVSAAEEGGGDFHNRETAVSNKHNAS
jgi:hypothetical protein